MQSATLPTVDAGEIMTHVATHVVGQVVETIRRGDNRLEGLEQVLLLSDGTRHSFRLAELRPATGFETRQFALAAME